MTATGGPDLSPRPKKRGARRRPIKTSTRSGPRGPILGRGAATTVRPALPALPAHDAARGLSGRFTIRQGHATVDDHVGYARRELLRLLERRVILDRRGIEHDDVREISGL